MADDIKLVVGVDYSDLTGLVKTSEQTKRVLSSAAKDFARTGNQKQYMHSINKIVQSQKQLDASSRMNRSQLMQLGAEMQREAKFTDELSRATHRLSGAMGASRNKMNGSNMAVQQLGYQVGDFAVQVQGGTSAFVAFSQQGAQLAGMLPMIAGPLGLSMKMAVGLSAAFGVLIPIGSAVGRMLFEMKDSAKEAAEEAETLDNKLESLNGTLEDYANALAALKAGVSLDELFATQGVEKASDALAEAEAALDSLNSATTTGSTGQIVFQSVVALLPGDLSTAEKYEVALQAVIKARTRLQLLTEKEADTRASNFAESSVAMKQELELLQAQARYGEDSAQAKNAGLDQELRNRLAAIDAQVVSGELDEAAAASLKLQAERAAELTAQIEAATAAEERRVAAIQVFYAYQTQIANQQQQRQAGVDDIADAMAKETGRLNNQISLNRQIAQFGEDSVEVAEERASQAREAYAQSLINQKILGSNLRTQMAAYDLAVQSEKEAKVRLETDRQRAALEANTADQQERLALAKAELEYGKESVEVARLRAEQEGIAQGYTDDALTNYINIEMVLRGIVIAIDAAADAEERRLAAVKAFDAYQTQIANRQAGVDAIADAMAKETLLLNNQIRLNRLIAQFGEDSVQVAEEKARQDREAYRQRLLDAEILGNNLRTQMAAYDQSVQAASAANDRLEADKQRLEVERQIAALEENTAKQQERLALAKAALEYGQDSVEVARLRAEQEGIGLGYADDALTAYIDIEMTIRDIVIATGKAADEASRLVSNLVLGQGYLAASVRSGVASGAIPPQALGDLPPTTSEVELERLREDARRRARSTTGGGGGGSDPFDQDAYLKSLQEEANFKNTLVGLGEAEITELERRREIVQKMTSDGQALNATDEERINKILATEAATRRAIAAEEQRQATFDMVSGHIEDAFMAMVDGSKSVEDAFKGMIRSILLDVYEQSVAKPMANALTSLLKFNKNGNAFSGGNVIPFANGGVVSSATMFPMAGNQTGVMGEAGPEAIMPLKRGANGKLGVQVQGGGENVVIHQNFNFQANGDDSVKRIIAQAAPQIANMTKKSMIDDRRRGGQMKATFG